MHRSEKPRKSEDEVEMQRKNSSCKQQNTRPNVFFCLETGRNFIPGGAHIKGPRDKKSNSSEKNRARVETYPYRLKQSFSADPRELQVPWLVGGEGQTFWFLRAEGSGLFWSCRFLIRGHVLLHHWHERPPWIFFCLENQERISWILQCLLC